MSPKPWFSGFKDKLGELLGPMNMPVWLGDEPIMAISIQLSPMVEVQLVPDKARWFEYDKVPFSNLVAGEKSGLGRDEVGEFPADAPVFSMGSCGPKLWRPLKVTPTNPLYWFCSEAIAENES